MLQVLPCTHGALQLLFDGVIQAHNDIGYLPKEPSPPLSPEGVYNTLKTHWIMQQV